MKKEMKQTIVNIITLKVLDKENIHRKQITFQPSDETTKANKTKYENFILNYGKKIKFQRLDAEIVPQILNTEPTKANINNLLQESENDEIPHLETEISKNLTTTTLVLPSNRIHVTGGSHRDSEAQAYGSNEGSKEIVYPINRKKVVKVNQLKMNKYTRLITPNKYNTSRENNKLTQQIRTNPTFIYEEFLKYPSNSLKQLLKEMNTPRELSLPNKQIKFNNTYSTETEEIYKNNTSTNNMNLMHPTERKMDYDSNVLANNRSRRSNKVTDYFSEVIKNYRYKNSLIEGINNKLLKIEELVYPVENFETRSKRVNEKLDIETFENQHLNFVSPTNIYKIMADRISEGSLSFMCNENKGKIILRNKNINQIITKRLNMEDKNQFYFGNLSRLVNSKDNFYSYNNNNPRQATENHDTTTYTSFCTKKPKYQSNKKHDESDDFFFWIPTSNILP